MPVELTPIVDPTTWAVEYDDIYYQMGDLVSDTGSDTLVFPGGDANTVISDWIGKETNIFEEISGKSTSEVTDLEEIDEWKTAIIYAVCIRVINLAIAQRLREREFTIAMRELREFYKAEYATIRSRQETVSDLVDYQEVLVTWD